MTSPARLRRSTVLVTALVGVVLMAGPAAATPLPTTPLPTIPSDVRAAFDGDALRQAQRAAADARASLEPAARALEPDFSDARTEDVHEVFAFSMDFIQGVPEVEPLSRTDQWMGSITRGDDVLGVLTVRKPDGGPAEFAGYSPDIAQAVLLGQVAATERLVVDAATGASYAVDDDTVRPLDDIARSSFPEPGTLRELQKVVAAGVPHAYAEGSDVPEAPGLPLALGAMALTLAIGVVLTLRQRRRSTLSA